MLLVIIGVFTLVIVFGVVLVSIKFDSLHVNNEIIPVMEEATFGPLVPIEVFVNLNVGGVKFPVYNASSDGVDAPFDHS